MLFNIKNKALCRLYNSEIFVIPCNSKPISSHLSGIKTVLFKK